jgi:hypothetical protein
LDLSASDTLGVTGTSVPKLWINAGQSPERLLIVDDFVAVGASKLNRDQWRTGTSSQRLQYQALAIYRIQ